MLRDKKGTFFAKWPIAQVTDFLETTLRRLCSPQVVGRGIFLLVLLAAAPAMAVQAHEAPEGYYVHQMAHLFFAVALVILLYLLHVRPVGQGKAWRLFKLSLFFFLLWNIWTCTAHWLGDHMPSQAFVSSGGLWNDRFIPQSSASSLLYYITRFDHLICVPAIWFLMQSLRTFCQEIDSKNKSSGADHE